MNEQCPMAVVKVDEPLFPRVIYVVFPVALGEHIIEKLGQPSKSSTPRAPA